MDKFEKERMLAAADQLENQGRKDAAAKLRAQAYASEAFRKPPARRHYRDDAKAVVGVLVGLGAVAALGLAFTYGRRR